MHRRRSGAHIAPEAERCPGNPDDRRRACNAGLARALLVAAASENAIEAAPSHSTATPDASGAAVEDTRWLAPTPSERSGFRGRLAVAAWCNVLPRATAAVCRSPPPAC